MQGAFLPEWIGAIAALAILLAVSTIQFRHIGSVLTVALAPLPGYVLSVALHAPIQPLCYLCGFFIADVFLAAVEVHVCEGSSAAAASKQALRVMGIALFWPLVLAICAMVVFSLTDARIPTLLLAMEALFCGVSALAVVLFAARFLPRGQEAIARANRLRERRERLLDGLAFLVQPRWGWSLSGIALVFIVLGFFGGQNLGAAWPFRGVVVLPAEGLLFALVAYSAIRNLRRTTSFVLSIAVLACISFWISVYWPVSGARLILTIAVSAAAILMMAVRSEKFARAGDTAAVAVLRASEQLTVPIIFFCVASSTALCALDAFASAALVACGGISAVILFPALTTVIYDLFPPRVSLDAYRIR